MQLHIRRCFVEAAISAGVKVGARRLDLSKRTDQAMGCAYGGNWPPDWKLEGVCAAQRLPPLPPEEVRQLLEKEKKFTAGRTDVDVVDGLYRRFFDGVSRAATVLDFHQLGWGASEAQALAAVLPHFSALQKINLAQNKFDAAAGSALAEGLRATGSLTECNVRGNRLDKESATVLATVATEKRVMLFGIKHDQKEANFSDQGLRPADAILIANDLTVSASLTEVRALLPASC